MPATAQIQLGADVGYSTVGLADGPGPSVSVGYARELGAGRLHLAARFSAVAIDRASLAEPYLYDEPSDACIRQSSEMPVDSYLCNPFSSGGEFLGAYSVEAAYAPGIPLAFGLGARFAEEVTEREGKSAQLRPFATALVISPVSERVSVQARARAGVGLVEGHVGLTVGL